MKLLGSPGLPQSRVRHFWASPEPPNHMLFDFMWYFEFTTNTRGYWKGSLKIYNIEFCDSDSHHVLSCSHQNESLGSSLLRLRNMQIHLVSIKVSIIWCTHALIKSKHKFIIKIDSWTEFVIVTSTVLNKEARSCAFAYDVPTPLDHVLTKLTIKWGRDPFNEQV